MCVVWSPTVGLYPGPYRGPGGWSPQPGRDLETQVGPSKGSEFSEGLGVGVYGSGFGMWSSGATGNVRNRNQHVI